MTDAVITLPAPEPEHSILGASSAERWMNCPGSVALIAALDLPHSDEPDYRIEGTAAHHFAAALLESGGDAWEIVGEVFRQGTQTVEADAAMADAIQVYLDECRHWMPVPLRDIYEVRIEQRLRIPQHRLGYGTADFISYDPQFHVLRVRDYKHGEGVVVEADMNPQLMYYAYAALLLFPDCRRVDMGIVQPRAFHDEGPVRTYEMSADALHYWAENTLIPAMLRAEMDEELDAGKWCRFCPAKLICPIMKGLFAAACLADPKAVGEISDTYLGRDYQKIAAAEQYIRALKEETLRRWQTGEHEIPGTKLVPKIAHRVWKPSAPEVIVARLGDNAYAPREMLSPAAVEKLGPDGKALVKEWAYSPQTGLTVALLTDKRAAVKVEKASSVLGEAAAKALATGEQT